MPVHDGEEVEIIPELAQPVGHQFRHEEDVVDFQMFRSDAEGGDVFRMNQENASRLDRVTLFIDELFPESLENVDDLPEFAPEPHALIVIFRQIDFPPDMEGKIRVEKRELVKASCVLFRRCFH
ncbi:MAG: hypothetical protein L6W00_26665 [Lentisphaeria bacterium]|nr:MAG: hypothetical protein L6W00_26665 [Lentisphaeria bacterium]